MIFRKDMLSGKRYYFSALALSGLLFLSACTAGSMRVDIEVYKGPLSKTKQIQIGELKGYVTDTVAGLENFITSKSKCNAAKDKFKFKSCDNFFKNLEALKTEFKALNNLWGSSQGFSSPANHLKRTLQLISSDIFNYESFVSTEGNRLDTIRNGLDVARNRLTAERNKPNADQSKLDAEKNKLNADERKLDVEINKFDAEINRLDNETPINTNSLKDNFVELEHLLVENSPEYLPFIRRTLFLFRNEFSKYTNKNLFLKISGLSEDLKSMIKTGARELERFDRKFLNDLLESTATLASRLHSSSFYWSSYANFRNLKGNERFFITEYTTLASEYSNQISSRTDALQKQLVGDSQDSYKNGRGPLNKEELPLSAYLRDTRPTDFTELYQWQVFSGELGSNPDTYSDNDIEMRINAFKHIFDDHFWSNINTVYASGGGDAHMAFIKDEIGNWTLKSFESDPTELVQAYKKLTLAALKAAANAAVTSGTGGISPELLATIGKLTSGRTRQAIDPATQAKIDELKKQTITNIEGLKSQPDSSATITKGKQILKDYENQLNALQGS